MSESAQAWLSDHRAEPELSWMIVLSVFVHVAALATVILMPGNWLARRPEPVIAYTVSIVDPSALGGRLTKGEIKPDLETAAVSNPLPKPEPKKVEPAPEPEPPKPVEQKKEPPKPEPEKVVKLPDVPKKPEPPKPTRQEVAKQKRDDEIQEAIKRLGEKGKGKQAAGLGGVEEGKGAALGVGGDGGGGGVLTGLDFILYKNRVEATIKSNWTWVGANPNLTIRVGFQIADDGQIAGLRIVQPSGDSSYDESVMRAIRISNPLPAPPEKYRQAFANYVLDFVSGELAKGG